ncbi:MAG: D-alanyl-lipoteichoic acid biosynthesis protein DltB [Bacillota bacterium]|nr:D-alanyl-lipoteichoic acid biosynthesis protein DltB [Bacillota bacterium]
MTPYSDFYYFYILAVVLLPCIILGLFQKKIKWYGLLVTIFMIYHIFASSKKQLVFLAAFFVLQVLLTKSYDLLRKKLNKRWHLWIIIIISLIPLFITKLSGVFIHKEIGFLGVSYLTFKCVQTIIQIYDGYIKDLNVLEYAYFILFFPTLSSGPIDRSIRFIKEINTVPTRKEYLDYLGNGLWKIVLGIAYKFLISSYINDTWVSKLLLKPHITINIIKYMYFYSFYLFFDFAGYSLIAIGVSYILGVKTPDNFNLPFISKDIKDFWNRWHMSLSFWFRDFIFNRFVMAAIKKKWFKSRYTAAYIGYFITMLIMGFWHGVQLNYIVYGVYHGVLVAGTDCFQKSSFYSKVKEKRVFTAVSTVITFNIVCFGFLIFSGYLFK